MLARAGVASRRQAEDLIRAGRVTVDGRVAQIGERVAALTAVVLVDGEPIEREPLRYWLLNKPRGVLSTCSDPEGRRTVLDLLPQSAAHERLFPVGRLDLDSQGLLLLTNDGATAQVLLHPSLGTIRRYEVLVAGTFGKEESRAIARGVRLEDGPTAPAHVVRVRRTPRGTEVVLELREGRKRQIRRSMGHLGCRVLRLERVAMGPLLLGKLPVGHARPLRKDERRRLALHVERQKTVVT